MHMHKYELPTSSYTLLNVEGEVRPGARGGHVACATECEIGLALVEYPLEESTGPSKFAPWGLKARTRNM